MFNLWHWYLREIWDSPAPGSICYSYKTRQHFYCPTGTEHYVIAVFVTASTAVVVLALVHVIWMAFASR